MQLIVLDATTKTLKAKLGESATTQPVFVASYADATSTDVTEGANDGAFNSTTDVTVVSAPGASTRRIIKDISVYNGDSISHTVTLLYDNNGTQRILWTGTITATSTFYLSRTLSAGGGSPLTTKGDLYTYGTGNTRLGVGTNGFVLTADSAETTGLKWAAASGGTAFWSDVPGTPTRVSDTQFTITDTSNANLYDQLFKKGVILKWLESSTFQTAMVISSSYGTNTVTVNIVGDSLTAGFSAMKYAIPMAQVETFIIPGTLAAGTDLAKTWYPPQDVYVLSADLYVKTAGSGTGSNVIDINDDGTTKFTTKPTVTTGTSDIDNVADNPSTAVAAGSAVTCDVDSVTATTAAIEAYVCLFYYPVSWRYRS